MTNDCALKRFKVKVQESRPEITTDRDRSAPSQLASDKWRAVMRLVTQQRAVSLKGAIYTRRQRTGNSRPLEIISSGQRQQSEPH